MTREYRAVAVDDHVRVDRLLDDGSWVFSAHCDTHADAALVIDARHTIDLLTPHGAMPMWSDEDIEQLNEACNTIVEMDRRYDDDSR